MTPEFEAYSVSQVAALIQEGLERTPVLSQLWVRGEISNFKRHTSGHLYFSIQDAQCAIRAVMFKGRAGALRFAPKNGMDCLFHGRVSLYAKEVQVQFYADDIVPAGVGAENLALEALKQKLADLGYFDHHRKKKLPFLPRGVGVVSSRTGAVIEDICQVVWRRYPGMPVYLYPALVQGEQAPASLAAGLAFMGGRPELDVVILARGGGSAQDLTAFNTERVAEAIVRCPKPVISAVGHETDVTVADLAADVRAATPSVAAELAVPPLDELCAQLNREKQRLRQGAGLWLRHAEETLSHYRNSLVWADAVTKFIEPKMDHLLHMESDLHKAAEDALERARYDLAVKRGQLQALSPLSTLERGYSICMDAEGRVISRAAQVSEGGRIQVRLARGQLDCLILTKEDADGTGDDL
ncbi:MAG: exodeoxyribonuclease VII large subunit [Peptococcaceae bacterium]|jgi:exodeoxyribonuclease VII large subunit|nr:exodeoxyribonuclease VII large subunit [Peptococcaceae bacterium]